MGSKYEPLKRKTDEIVEDRTHLDFQETINSSNRELIKQLLDEEFKDTTDFSLISDVGKALNEEKQILVKNQDDLKSVTQTIVDDIEYGISSELNNIDTLKKIDGLNDIKTDTSSYINAAEKRKNELLELHDLLVGENAVKVKTEFAEKGVISDTYLSGADCLSDKEVEFVKNQILTEGRIPEKVEASSLVNKIIDSGRISVSDRKMIREGIIAGEIGEEDIRAIGNIVRGKYDEVLAERNRVYEELDRKKRLISEMYCESKSKEEEAHWYVEMRLIQKQYDEAEKEFSRPNIIKNIIETVRKCGSSDTDSGQLYETKLFNKSKNVINAIEYVRNFIPSEWVDKSNSNRIITRESSRGYFNEENGKIMVVLSTGDMTRCAFHELGHMFEFLFPEIRIIEHEFYSRRTKGEELQWLGIPYARGEKTRFDNFVNAYMGKDYGNTKSSYYELFSMGMEALFAGSINLTMDVEYQDLIFGLLIGI